MKIFPKSKVFSLCLISACLWASCNNAGNEEDSSASSVLKVSGVYPQKILTWHVMGPLSSNYDECSFSDYLSNPEKYYSSQNPHSSNSLWFNNTYLPKFNQLDYKEVYELNTADSIQDQSVYIFSKIESSEEIDLFLHIRSSLYFEPYFNSMALQRRDIQGENFYPVHLQKGENIYVVKTKITSNDTWFETEILDSLSVASMYVNGQSNNIFYPLVSSMDNILTMTNAHQNILNCKANFRIQDVRGKSVATFHAQKGIYTCQINSLKDGVSYLCTMNIAGKTTKQPIVCGDYDEVYQRFVNMRQRLGENHPRGKEIDQLLYRLNFLLNHPTRKTDWWWQFKIPPITYQLEHTFAHLSQTLGQDNNDFNLKFVTYQSKLDNGIQRYLLVTPDSISPSHKYPLVVVIRPQVTNHHHFFTAPQFTHQWAINIMQGLANKHGFIVMMPEGRMYLDEDITPFTEAEIKLAINDLSDRYNIDNERIYLHGICSGGNRALKMAALNPDLFAAIAMYAPTYNQEPRTDWEEHRSIRTNLSRLAGTPVFVFADPHDQHTDSTEYLELIRDCKNQSIPVEFIQKINTEYLYNAMVVGEEAFDFFDGKRKKRLTQAFSDYNHSLAVADLFNEPFVYVFDHDNTSGYYQDALKSIYKDYSKYFETPLPIVPDNMLTEKMLCEKNLFLVGSTFCNRRIQSLIESANINLNSPLNAVSIHRNPDNGKKFVVLQINSHHPRMLRFPWIEGTQAYIQASEI